MRGVAMRSPQPDLHLPPWTFHHSFSNSVAASTDRKSATPAHDGMTVSGTTIDRVTHIYSPASVKLNCCAPSGKEPH